MRTGIVKDSRFADHTLGPDHVESPERIIVLNRLAEDEFRDSVRHIEPRAASDRELEFIHSPDYIRLIRSTAGRERTPLDPDTSASPLSWETARLAAGGTIEAALLILEGRVRNGLALVRPPGHHAEAAAAKGFCLFNNIALAAESLIRDHGLKRILIVDWDLHHGNGTQHSFSDRKDVLYFSSHQFPHYPGTGDFNEVGTGKGEGFTVNAPFPAGFGDAEYIEVYSRILRPIALQYRPELVLVSAGFDPYVKDPLGGMEVTGSGFGNLMSIIREIADETCKGKVLLTLEGGYNPDGLREGVQSVLHALTGPRWNVPTLGAPKAERVIQTIISHHKKYWKGLK